jgi:hypothetical protein
MRITIELSEAEGRSATIDSASHPASAQAAGPESPTTDGGAAPLSLLMALGAPGVGDAGTPAGPSAPDRQGIDAGGPPEWLMGVIEGGR